MIKLITEILVAIAGSVVFCLMIKYFYSKLLLEGFSRELYESKNIENFIASEPNSLEDVKELAKMNIQTVHSFLVMLIAVVALIFSLYNLLKPLPFSFLSILIILFILIGISVIIFVINYRWYNIYIKSVNANKPEKIQTKANDVMQATYTEIFKLDTLNFRFSISRKAQRRQCNPDASL